jgi:GMP synthase-like glutamine amidotransferase
VNSITYKLIDLNEFALEPGTVLQRFEGFENALVRFEQNRIHFSECSKLTHEQRQHILHADKLILSGSGLNLAASQKDWNTQTITLLKDIEWLISRFRGPILGICFGMQYLAYLCGIRVRPIPPPNQNAEATPKIPVTLRIRANIPILGLFAYQTIQVELNHHQEIDPTQIPPTMLVFGSTFVTPIQIVQFSPRPWYGVQFHPETMQNATWEVGHHILRTFVDYPTPLINF